MAKIMESPIYLSKNENIKVKLEEEFYETGEIKVIQFADSYGLVWL